MYKFAVISFPGTNCELEAVRAFKRNGMDAETVLWNDPGMLDGSRTAEFDGYCIAGGFSYEDRGRSGIVASQDPITEVLRQEADRGKIILGICNGAQVLVETGLVPGFEDKALGMALAWNEMKQDGQVVDTGFYNAWSYLKNTAPKGRTAFNHFDDLLHVPFAHGEGRFMIEDELLKKMEENGQIIFKYCDAQGQIDARYPITPNGATAAVAAVCNPAGNVMAIMPHPERDPMGNGNLIFSSIKTHLDGQIKAEYKSLGAGQAKENIQPKSSFDLEFYVRLIITDNTERTIEETLLRKGLSLHLDRFEFFGVNVSKKDDLKAVAQKILNSGELANFNKQLVYIKIGEEMFQYDPQNGFRPKNLSLEHALITADLKDFAGEAKKAALDLHVDQMIEKVVCGVLWNFTQTDESTIQKVIESKVLYNPYSMVLYK